MAEEREVKLDVEDDFQVPGLHGLASRVEPVPRATQHLRAVYYDTDDLALLRMGYGLRHRTDDGGTTVWTLKANTSRVGGALVRDEQSVEADAGGIPSDLARQLPEGVRVERLQTVAVLRTERRPVDLVRDGVRLAEVVDDRVDVLRADAVAGSFRELEVELTHPDAVALVDATVARLLQSGAALQPESEGSKYVRALRLLGRLPAAGGRLH
jgi:inorganic triphosphatase YgiF